MCFNWITCVDQPLGNKSLFGGQLWGKSQSTALVIYLYRPDQFVNAGRSAVLNIHQNSIIFMQHECETYHYRQCVGHLQWTRSKIWGKSVFSSLCDSKETFYTALNCGSCAQVWTKYLKIDVYTEALTQMFLLYEIYETNFWGRSWWWIILCPLCQVWRLGPLYLHIRHTIYSLQPHESMSLSAVCPEKLS